MKNRIKPWARHAELWKKVLGKIKYIPFIVYGITQSRDRLIKKEDKLNREYNQLVAEYYEEAGGITAYGTWTVPAKCFETLKEKKFEGIFFSVPGESELYLKSIYGDYMQLPPIEERENRHQVLQVKL